MGFDLKVNINSSRIKNPKAFAQAALEAGGRGFIAAMQDYPPQKADSTYARTGTLGNKAQFSTVEYGETLGLHFGGESADDGNATLNDIFTWLMLGTGIYGPTGEPIRPTTAQMLSWVATGGSMAGERIFAKEVQGSIWEGKLEDVRAKIIDYVEGFVRSGAEE